ncbi:MAG: hypothetical protein IKN73_00715 [Alphaproteobacteria bacterium]|nr:hypothetical protein [Alphaproteobacteria bacterium]
MKEDTKTQLKFIPVAIICTVFGVSLHTKSCSNSAVKPTVKKEAKELKQVQDTIRNYVQFSQEIKNGR